MPSDPAIEIEGLTVTLGGVPRIEDISLRVPRGQFHGVVGPNGAGKSTLLRVLYRALTPQAGRVRLFGRDLATVTRPEWVTLLGALVQDGGTLQGLSVRDVVEIGCMGLACSSKERAARVARALEITGLIPLAAEQAALISGGERQKTHLAQLFARDPEIYVLDEPTNHLDLRAQYLLLDEVAQRRKTVVATFHDIELAARYCACVTVLSEGRVAACGAPQEVLDSALLREVFGIEAAWSEGRLRVEGAWRG